MLVCVQERERHPQGYIYSGPSRSRHQDGNRHIRNLSGKPVKDKGGMIKRKTGEPSNYGRSLTRVKEKRRTEGWMEDSGTAAHF